MIIYVSVYAYMLLHLHMWYIYRLYHTSYIYILCFIFLYTYLYMIIWHITAPVSQQPTNSAWQLTFEAIQVGLQGPGFSPLPNLRCSKIIGIAPSCLH